MALEHAILVSLSERSGSGLDLTRRFDRSIGFFWTATHQQIYRVLARMERDGWVTSTQVPQQGRPDKKVYEVTAAGRRELERWIGEPLVREQHRSDLAVRLRAASYGDRAALLEGVAALRAEHGTRLAHFEQLQARDFPDPSTLDAADLDRYLVLRGGALLERFWVDWLGEYLAAHQPNPGARA
jgi:DNA-binding PadR family transcriptional regulator